MTSEQIFAAVIFLLAEERYQVELLRCKVADDKERVAAISPTLAHQVWRERNETV